MKIGKKINYFKLFENAGNIPTEKIRQIELRKYLILNNKFSDNFWTIKNLNLITNRVKYVENANKKNCHKMSLQKSTKS